MDIPIKNKRFHIKMNNGDCFKYTTNLNLFEVVTKIQKHEHFMIDGEVIIFTRNVSSVVEV